MKLIPFKKKKMSKENLEDWKNKLQNPQTREEAIYQLGKEGTKTEVAVLLPFLKYKDEDIRWLTAETIERLATKEKIDSNQVVCDLTDLVINSQESLGVRQAAAKALEKIGSTEAIISLVNCLENPQESWFVRKSVAIALKNFYDKDERVFKAMNGFLRQIEPNQLSIVKNESAFCANERSQAEKIFSESTLAQLKKLILFSNFSWQDFIAKLQEICQMADTFEKTNQAINYLTNLGNFNLEYAYEQTEKGQSQKTPEAEQLEDEVYNLANHLIEEMEEFLKKK